MNCSDDIPGDLSTDQTVSLGTAFSSTIGHEGEDCQLDVDYFKVQLEYGQLYEIVDNITTQDSNTESYARVRLRDKYDLTNRNRNTETNTNSFGPDSRLGAYRAAYSGTHYIRVAQRNVYGDRDYNLTVRPISHVATIPVELTLGLAATDQLTDEVDRVVFRIETIVGKTYLANVFGADGGLGTLEDPWLGIGDQTNQYFDDNSGNGRNPFIQFTAKKTFAYIHVGGTGAGDFRVNVRKRDEVPVGTATRARIEPGTAVSQDIETPSDIDWFRVPMQKGKWHRVTTIVREDLVNTIIRNPDLSIESIIRPENQLIDDPGQINDYGNVYGVTEYSFQADSSGDHFVIARAQRPERLGKYDIFIEQTAAPLNDGFHVDSNEEFNLRRFKVTNDEVVHVKDLFDLGENVASGYQIMTGTGLYRDGVAQDSGGIVNVPADEIELWTHQMVAHDETVDVWVRARIGDVWTRWDRTPIYHQIDNPDLKSGSTWPLTEEYPRVGLEFADSLPSWFEGVYTGFQSISGTGSSTAVASIELQIDELVRRSSDGEIKIFRASNVDGYVDAYAPGTEQGGDIVLNSSIYTDELDVKHGTREHLELLKGFAIALGLQEASTSSNQYSVMSADEVVEGSIPYTFLAQDVLALESMYGVKVFPFRNYKPGLADPNGFGLSPTFKNGKHVDLRQGGEVTYRIEDLNNEFNYIDTKGFMSGPARSGGIRSHDRTSGGGIKILGNSFNNSLYLANNSGSGWMDGRAGDDTLYGGPNSNWFGYQVGHGDDVIVDNQFENELRGNDTLRLIGHENITLSLDNLQFTRRNWIRPEGNFLDSHDTENPEVHLRIDVLNEQGNSEGSVTIQDQGLEAHRVESLEIYTGVSPQSRINLQNLFNQLSPNEATQFELSGGSNNLGSFVAPI